ncbi:MAG: hypothetical protein OIN86_16355 [Candidatus Methanoperedens sp.]|nr:hypothetical protein [Candidatus Methanoperedens sp.]CAG1007066.1 hypothetical protein METP1_03408 [Methanosarcinales archaeon]
MKSIEELAKNKSDSMIFQDIKTPEEYKWRYWALNSFMNGEHEKTIEYCNKGFSSVKGKAINSEL